MMVVRLLPRMVHGVQENSPATDMTKVDRLKELLLDPVGGVAWLLLIGRVTCLVAFHSASNMIK